MADELIAPEREVLDWYTPAQLTPPVKSCLFVRLERKTDGVVNFSTALWDPEKGFLYWRLEDNATIGSGLIPPFYTVTHWALSERTNEAETPYAWRERKPEELPKPEVTLMPPPPPDLPPPDLPPPPRREL